MNKILFSERLREQRRKCGYDSITDFAKKYNETFPAQRKDRKYENKGDYSGILGTLKNYENPNKDCKPRLDIVDNLCKLLNCDIDYLLGNMECETHDKQFIHDRTGLSENAINKLLELYNNACSRLEIWDPESCLDIINNLLASEDFMHLIQAISNADSCAIEVIRLNDILSDIIKERPRENKTKIISNIDFNVGELARFKFQIISMFHRMIKIRYSGIGEWCEQYKNDFTIKKQ